MSEVDVVVVGAGAAGLTAAYFLQQKNNLTVKILEANSVLGGRLQKDASLGWPIDIGGEWIHMGTNSDYTNPNELFKEIYEWDFNLSTVLDPQEMSYYITNENKIYKEGVFDIADYRWKDGTWWDFLNTEVAAKLSPNTIVYDCVVQTIDYSSSTNNNNSSTIATTCANGNSDSAQLYKSAMANFDMQPGLKAFLEFSEQFYPVSPVFVDTDIDWYEMDTQTAADYGERIFYDETFGKDTNLNIMGFFAYAHPAEYYISKGKDFVIQDILAELDDMYDGKASATFKKGIVQDWSVQPYAKTGYTKWVYGERGTINLWKTPINNKVYFAGEALPDDNSNWGYAHLAAASGKRAANQIMGKSSSATSSSFRMATVVLVIPSLVLPFLFFS